MWSIGSWHHSAVPWTMRLPKTEEAALEAQARAEGRSKREITRDAVRAYLERSRRSRPLSAQETVDPGIANDAFDIGMHWAP
ncbi:ribbon-helix-helix protein, CopG family [Nocardia pneumoniae]|uniref:ribbon-helix-helix protein, CopG family n=1 Tax=Nocardia pneumoniae TaxID=228601 RepID=UPI000A055F37